MEKDKKDINSSNIEENKSSDLVKEVSSVEKNKKKDKSSKKSSNKKSENSFYERQDDVEKTSWVKDWRGKTLMFLAATLVLIGVGIPIGMLSVGYFENIRDEDYDVDEVDNVEFSLATDELSRIKDQALLEHYELMIDEGWITQTQYDNDIENAEETADDQVKNEKDSIKDEYGNTWKDEWDQSLQEKGFHTSDNNGEQEYKDSIIASTIETKIKTTYTSTNVLTQQVSSSDNVTYYSDVSDDGKYLIIENRDRIYYRNKDDADYHYYSPSFTPEDLVTLYLLTYQPIVFNNTLLPFTPVLGNSDTSDVNGSNLTVTNDNILSIWSFYKMLTTGSDFSPKAKNYGGIQSKYDITFTDQSLGSEVDNAVNFYLSGSSESVSSTTNLESIISLAFASMTVDDGDENYDVNDITSTEISNLNDDNLVQFANSLRDSLVSVGLMSKSESKKNFSIVGLINDNIVSVVSTNGLNNIGVQFEGDEIVKEQLNSNNMITNSIDLGFADSFGTWFDSAFDYIITIDYLTNPKDNGLGWFDEENNKFNLELRKNEDGTNFYTPEEDVNYLIKVFLIDLWIDEKKVISENYNSMQDFYETNWKYYDLSEFNDVLGKDYLNFLESKPLNVFLDDLDSWLSSTKLIFFVNDNIILTGGENNNGRKK